MRILVLVAAMFSLHVHADVLRSLPSKDKLYGVARQVGAVLNEGNISTGTTKLSAGLLNVKSIPNTDEEMKAVTEKGFHDALKAADEEMAKARVVPEVEAALFVNGAGPKSTVGKMTAAIMESNAYDTTNMELWNKSLRQVWAVLRKLPVDAESRVGQVTIQLHDNGTDSDVYVRYFLIVNKDSRAVQLFTIQGSM